MSDLMDGFAEFLELNSANGAPSPHTLRSYETNARQWLAWCDEHEVNAGTATQRDMLRYRRDLVDEYTPGTASVKLVAVRRLYDAAIWDGLRETNPASRVKAPPDRTDQAEKIRYLSLDGLRDVLNAPEGDTPTARRDRAILALMGRHGLRVAEVAGLDMHDVDFEGQVLHVTGKGSKRRAVHLVESTSETLQAWLEARESDGEALFVSAHHAHRGERLTTIGIRYVVDGYLKALGLKEAGISCHSLRHSAATWARAGGAKIDAISDWLGHASVDTTRIYVRIVDRVKENPARHLEALLVS